MKNILMILAVVVVAGVGYFAFVNKSPQVAQQTSTPTPTKTAQATKSPTPTPNTTANWKTYTNMQYGFEFKYPDNWVTSDSSNGNFYILDILPQGKSREEYYPITALVVKNTSESDFIKGEMALNKDLNPVLTQKNGTLGGQTATDYVIQRTWQVGGIAYGYTMFYAITTKNNSLYMLDWNDNISAKNSSDKVLYDQILSTFKFTK